MAKIHSAPCDTRHWIINLTEQFLERYPEERYRHAHAVLDDDNYDDASIRTTLQGDYNFIHDDQDVATYTRHYLEWLLGIPEIFRDPYYFED